MDEHGQNASFPPPDRLYWMRPPGSKLKLFYLTWGRRFYGRQPSPFVRAKYWCCVAVRAGTPTLVLTGEEVPLAPRDVVVIHPDCVYCLRDQGNRSCEVLGWQWGSPPACSGCAPPARGLLHWRASAEDLSHLEQIHSACRKEVFRDDEYTALSLDHLRIALDVTLARSRTPKSGQSREQEQFDVATRWMQQHLHAVEPVQHICDYLQISASTLRRLFLRRGKESPASYFHRLKMERARELLRRTSVKEVAYRLGYHYPNDFSAAYKDYFGVNPTSQGSGRKAPRA